MPVTDISKEKVVLVRVSYIYYPLCFEKDNQNKARVPINSGNKVNAIIAAYTLKLGFRVYHTNVEVQKIDDSISKMFKMVMTSF